MYQKQHFLVLIVEYVSAKYSQGENQPQRSGYLQLHSEPRLHRKEALMKTHLECASSTLNDLGTFSQSQQSLPLQLPSHYALREQRTQGTFTLTCQGLQERLKKNWSNGLENESSVAVSLVPSSSVIRPLLTWKFLCSACTRPNSLCTSQSHTQWTYRGERETQTQTDRQADRQQ